MRKFTYILYLMNCCELTGHNMTSLIPNFRRSFGSRLNSGSLFTQIHPKTNRVYIQFRTQQPPYVWIIQQHIEIKMSLFISLLQTFYFKLEPQRIKTSAECAEVAFSLSDSPPTLLHPSCVRNTFPPLHPSHVLKFISHYLCRLVSPLPSPHIHPPTPPTALLSQWQSHHTLSIRLVRRCSAAWHSPARVPSLPLTLSVTLKRFQLPDIILPHPHIPPRLMQVSRWKGVEIRTRLDFHLAYSNQDVWLFHLNTGSS